MKNSKCVALFDFNNCSGYTVLIKIVDSLDQKRVDSHIKSNLKHSTDVVKISKKKVISEFNSRKCDIYKIDGELYEVFSDCSCLKISK